MSLVTKGLAVKGLVNGLIAPPAERWVYDFDGLDDYGLLDDKAINVEGDNTLEFWSPSVFMSNIVIISQNITITFANREFELSISPSFALQLLFGGSNTTLYNVSLGFKPSTRYGLTLTGTTFQLFEGGLNGTLLRSGSFTRGTAREPGAKTTIGARSNGAGSFSGFFNGPQRDIKINGVLWEMRNNGSTIQPSTPAGNKLTLVNMNPDRWSKIPV